VQILDVERVIVAFSNDSHEEMLDLIRSLKDLDIQIDLVPRFFEVIGTNVGIHTAEGLPLIGLPPLRLSRSSIVMKRAMDLVFSVAGLIVLSPFLLATAVWIKLDSNGPIFFRQLRMGSGDVTFQIFKFRTMEADADARKVELAELNKHNGNGGDPRMFKIPHDPRVTRAGRFLRKYSIDELPQLLNVVRGEMSLVGPRPLILEEDQHVVDWRRQRLSLKPGITGLWQVHGRDDIPFEEMVQLDYVYVTTWSLLNDLKLILRTLPALVRARDC
jgi:exopolysaccharide biosynthesis polyprenyl glycosylphosphotransferase